MNKKDLKSRLSTSIKQEEISLHKRFESADKIMIKNKVPKTSIEHNEKAIRGTFTLPESTINNMESIIMKAALKGVILNKSEVIRTAISQMILFNDKEFNEIIQNIERLKKGRPS